LEGITAKETRLHDPPAAPQLLFVDGFADKAWHCDKTMPNAAQSIFFANYKPLLAGSSLLFVFSWPQSYRLLFTGMAHQPDILPSLSV
jgi:hypothetical protein